MLPAITVLLLGLADVRGAPSLQPSLRDYVHTAWTQHDGVALSSIDSITQTTDGYLWLVTREEGLLRFDGVRFVNEPSPLGPLSRVMEAASDRAGGLWILCDYKLFHREANGATRMVKQNIVSAAMRPSMNFFVDREKRLWLWGDSLGYLRPDGSEGGRIAGTARRRGATYCYFTQDSDGNLWFSNAEGLMKIREGRAERVLTGKVLALAPARAGGIYAVRNNWVLHVNGESISKVPGTGEDLTIPGGNVLEETGAGLWLGTQNAGVALLRDGKAAFFGRAEGLSSAAVSQVFEDREGSVWVGTPLGLHRFREPLAYLMKEADGVPPGMPRFLDIDHAGGVWIGSGFRMTRLDETSGAKRNFDAEYISIGEDGEGRIWLATNEELGFLRGNRFVPVRDAGGAEIAEVDTIQKDENGGVWALSEKAGLYEVVGGVARLQIPVRSGHTFLASHRQGIWIGLSGGRLLRRLNGSDTVFTKESGFQAGSVRSIRELGDSIWIATEKGLFRRRNEKWTVWTVTQGLPGRGSIFEVLADGEDRLWLMSDSGILVLHRKDLDAAPDGQPRRLSYLRIGSLDRVLPHRGGMTSSPRAARAGDGRLYFATYDSVAVVDPARIHEQALVPSIVLESVLVDRRPVAPGVSRFVEPEDIQFEYTSLSLRSPENVRFRYRLLGRDADWVEAGTQRRAMYGALKPGAYTFRVIGSGSEGAWNMEGASYSFRIAEPFYKTPFFLAAAAAALAAMFWLVQQYRVKLAAERVRVRLEARNAERLRIAQDMHDSFLQGIHGVSLTVFAALGKVESDPREARRLLDRTVDMVAESTGQAREMLRSLRGRAGDSGPLADRLECMAAEECGLYPEPPRISIEASGTTRELQRTAAEDVYLIASEGIKNALRHARARAIRVSIECDPRGFRLAISDDGVGIESEIREHGRVGHFGLRGMRERAERHGGLLEIRCAPGEGTKLCLTLPAARAYRE